MYEMSKKTISRRGGSSSSYSSISSAELQKQMDSFRRELDDTQERLTKLDRHLKTGSPSNKRNHREQRACGEQIGKSLGSGKRKKDKIKKEDERDELDLVFGMDLGFGSPFLD